MRYGPDFSRVASALAWYGQQCFMTAQIHGHQCLRCIFSPIKKVSAKNSCCTAVRDAKKFGLNHCKVGELPGHGVVNILLHGGPYVSMRM
jgi:hypothetical protein